MKAGDTVMDRARMVSIVLRDCSPETVPRHISISNAEYVLVQNQAQISFKAGIKEVVDFILSEIENRNPADWYSKWQAKLKEWGIE